MSLVPLASLFHGDITIEQGCDTSNYGFGDLFVNRQVSIGLGLTTASTNSSTGSLIVYGGVGVSENINLDGNLTVLSTTNLKTTFINTALGVFSVTGGNSAIISVGEPVLIASTSGNTSVISTNKNTLIQGGNNTYDAVQITATNAAGGGVSVLSGDTGQISLTAGSGGIQGVASSGNINLTANNGSGRFVVNSSAGNQNLILAQYGATDSGIIITAAGDNTTNSAIKITTTNTGGNININNNGGLGQGSVTTLTGSGGYILTTNTGGPIQITAEAASSYIVVNSIGASQDLIIGVNGKTDSSLILKSEGTGIDAISIKNTNTNGSILISQPGSSTGKVDIETGSAGLIVNTQTGGGIRLTANGSNSSFINKTDGNGQDLKIAVEGTSGSKLILNSQGSGNQSILIQATGVSGGIFATAAGQISINSSDNIHGINIGTSQLTPINIGTPSSITTVYGDLDVRGVTTTFESTVVTIADNLLELNSAPGGIADAGVALKRYQLANDTSVGAVVSDTPSSSGTAQNASAGQITLSIEESEPDNFYNGYWVKIISGTGSQQVRRIKTYSSVTRIASIYTTADQTGLLNNPTPVEGLDWTTIPDTTSIYGLYPCQYIVSMWDEAAKEYALVCSNLVSGATTIPIANYINLHVNNIIANALTVNTINETTADVRRTFTLIDNSTTPVIITNFPSIYGVFIVLVRPTTATSTRCSGIFVIGRLNSGSCGQSARLISVRGTSNEQLDISWPSNSLPQVFYRPAPGSGTTTEYTVKIISV